MTLQPTSGNSSGNFVLSFEDTEDIFSLLVATAMKIFVSKVDK